MIHIYKQEALDGLSDRIKATAKVVYDAPLRSLNNVEPFSVNLDFNLEDIVPELAKASTRNDWDLFPFGSVLVSVGEDGYGWNDNDDVFDSGEAWAAKDSPVNKPLNYMHNELDIVGHMTKAIVMDESGNLIEDDEVIPEKYDIVVANILYRVWDDEKQQDKVDKIIAEIPENKWYVSMECLFKNFDYALISPEGEHSILPRNQATAYLTKHLRCYGGTGTYENYRIGRLIRNLTFSGNAIVDNPANPRSIIFHKNDPFQTTANIIPKQEQKNMADTDNILVVQQLKDDVAKLTARLEKEQNEKEKLIAEAQQAEQDKLQKQIASLQVDIEDLQKKVEAKDARTEELEKELSGLQAQNKELQAEKEEAMKDLEKAKKEKAKSSRISKLVDANVPLVKAESLVEKFDNLTDEQFDDIVEIQAMPYNKEKGMDDKEEDMKKKKEEKAKKEKAAEAALEDAETQEDELNLNLDQDEEDATKLEELKASASSWFKSVINNNK